MKKFHGILLWPAAIIITLSSAVYQRTTGPTYPVSSEKTIAGQTVKFSLLRTHDTGQDALIRIPVPDQNFGGEYIFKRYRSHDDWTTHPLVREGDNLIARLPSQPPAGKVMYQISLVEYGGEPVKLTPAPVIMRFKGAVPGYILLPHVLFMFLAMLVSNRSGLQALARGENLYRYALVTAVLLFLGGIILGPIVQKFAFGAFWTGWPFGHDLTDNKTLVAFLAWGLALWKNRRKARPGWILAASLILLLVYMVPHSVLGSEIDYTAIE